MAFIDLGKLKFNWQGTWNNVTAYETDDVVFHGSQTFVATADVAAGQAEPQANVNWSLMAAGFNYRGNYAGGTTYYLHDVVTYGSALYMLEGIAETGSQTGVDPGSNPGSDNWEILTPAPAANVMHQPGDMVFRNNANANTRLAIVDATGRPLKTVEAPKETYSTRQFTYTLNGTNGNVINTAGTIPAVSYSITTKNQRTDNYIIDGSDRDGDINWEYDGIVRVNIGDTIVFDNTATHAAHPMAIRVADGGASVTTGTYSGEGTATVTWVTTGVAAGTYYYQCQNHAGMIGQIIVESTENRQGSAGANGTMEVCRGKTYTITLDGLTSGLSYNLFTAAAPQAGVGNAVTSGEGNGTPAGTTYSGAPITFTFTPNETTPNTVYLTSASNTNDQVEITVNDLAYVPAWQSNTSLVFDDSNNTNKFTLQTGDQTADLSWTLPTAAPSAGDILEYAADGTTSYRQVIDWQDTAINLTATTTGIPADIRAFTLHFFGWYEAAANMIIYLGTSAGLHSVAADYVGASGYTGGASASAGAAWATAIYCGYGNNFSHDGHVRFRKPHPTANQWTVDINMSMRGASAYMFVGGGYVSLPGVLDRIYINGTSGTAYLSFEK